MSWKQIDAQTYFEFVSTFWNTWIFIQFTDIFQILEYIIKFTKFFQTHEHFPYSWTFFEYTLIIFVVCVDFFNTHWTFFNIVNLLKYTMNIFFIIHWTFFKLTLNNFQKYVLICNRILDICSSLTNGFEEKWIKIK